MLGALRAAGHDASMEGPSVEAVDADVLVVDLGSAGFDGVEVVERLRAARALATRGRSASTRTCTTT